MTGTQSSVQSEYDLFVSYSQADRGWVEGYLLDALHAANLKVLSEVNFSLGAPRILEFERAIKSCKRTLLVLSPAYMAEGALQLVDVMTQHYGLESGTWPVIPLLLRPVELPPRLAFIVSLDATDPENWTDVIDRLCSTLLAGPPAPAVRPRCPYPGMRAFREEETTHFYGREAEVDDLVNRLRRHPFVVVTGSSGSGKSSLVSAGLVPALRASSFFGTGKWLVRTLRPGVQPMTELTVTLGTDDPRKFVLADLLRQEQGVARLLLVVDQFEEVFTQGNVQKEEFFDFIRWFVSLRDCYVVITVRIDFLQDFANSSIWPLIQTPDLVIAPLGEQGLRAAIAKPAEDVGVFIESALVERLTASSVGQPGLLPFVQEVMVRLWDKLERRYLPLRAYEALVLPLAGYSGSERSGIVAAMAQFADEIINQLPLEQQRIAQRTLLRLVQFGEGRADTRRQQPVSALAAVGDDMMLFDRTLGYLTENRLLVFSGSERSEARVDLAHEAMLTGWPLLKQWIEEYKAAEIARRRLEAKAAEWVRLGQGEGGLLDWIELQEVEAWLQESDSITGDCSANLTALIEQSRERRCQQVRRRNIKRAVVYTVLGLVAIVFISFGVNTLRNWSLNRHWQAVTGPSSTGRASVLAGNQNELVIGSYDSGVGWIAADDGWIGWLRAGLPVGNPAFGLDNPQANVQKIDAVALDEKRPEDRYVFINDRGIFKFDEVGVGWSEISHDLPRRSDACSISDVCQPLAAFNNVVVYIADEPGAWLSEDGGRTWRSLRPDIAAASGTLYAAAFDSQGRLLLGDEKGLIRGIGNPSYTWERIFGGGKVVQVTPNPHGGMLLVVEIDDAVRTLCIDGNDMVMGQTQPLPVAVRMLAWSPFYPIKVTAAAADLRSGDHYFFATNHGAVYATDCVRSPVRIGQRPWFLEGVGRLATTVVTNQEVLYWATLKRLLQYAPP